MRFMEEVLYALIWFSLGTVVGIIFMVKFGC